MIRKANMDGVVGYGDGVAQVPKGGYVCKILQCLVKENSKGQYLELSCDIAEGEYKDVFATDYRNQSGDSSAKKWHCNAFVNVPLDNGTEQDGWTKRAFKTFIDALEDSNAGYHFDWDDSKIKGLMVGGLFVSQEYRGRDGSIRTSTTIGGWTSAQKIRDGKYKLPKDKVLKDSAPRSGGNDGFTPISDDSDLPF